MHIEGKIRVKADIAVARRRARHPCLLFAASVVAAAFATAARAGEPTPVCSGFCTPIAAKQLEGTRGAGSDTQTGVILWDELRRQAAPPPPPPSNAGDDTVTVHGPGSTLLAGTKSR